MKKLLIISMLFLSGNLYSDGWWGYYILKLNIMTPTEISKCEQEFNNLTNNKYTTLKYLLENSNTVENDFGVIISSNAPTRRVAECFSTIEIQPNVALAILQGKIVKIKEGGTTVFDGGKVDYKNTDVLKYELSNSNSDWKITAQIEEP